MLIQSTLWMPLLICVLLPALTGCETQRKAPETDVVSSRKVGDTAVDSTHRPTASDTARAPASQVGSSGAPEEPLPTGSESLSVQVIGDTTVVTTRRPASLDTAHLVQVARIGRFDGPEEYLLTGVEAFAVGAYGEIYVADGGIRVFAPDGSAVRQISRTGEGPGEVGPVSGMEVDESGRLLAVDIRNRRVAVLDTSGVPLDHWRLPDGRPGYGRNAIIPIPGNEALLHLNPWLDPSGGPQAFPRPIYVRLDSAGAVLDTVFAPARLTKGCPTLDDSHFSIGFWQDLREPLFPKVKWTASRTGEVVLGCPAKYEIDRVQPDGTVLRISHERDPMSEPAEVRRRFVESREENPPWGNQDWHWEGPRPPENKPYYHQLIVGRGGRLWVWPGHLRVPIKVGTNPVRTTWVDPTTGTFDVFESDGRFLGPVLLPDGVVYEWHPGYEAPFFAGDTVWMVRRDSLDVRYIDRMLIEWPTGNAGSG